MTAAIQTLVEATEMDRIHVANLVAENTNIKRKITTITTEMATIKNLMGKIQAQINQLALNIPQGIVHQYQHKPIILFQALTPNTRINYTNGPLEGLDTMNIQVLHSTTRKRSI